MTLGLDVVVLGVITGLTYAVLAMGLVIVYKAARFINFAQGNLGTVSAALLGKFVADNHWPYWPTFFACIALGGALGGLVELTVIRRLFRAPRLVLMVASIGVAQIFLGLTQVDRLRASPLTILKEGYPKPSFGLDVTVGGLRLTDPDFMILLVVPALAAALAAFFRWSAYGQAIRAASENPDAARLAGISVRRMSTLVWVIAGLLSAASAVLLAPKGFAYQFGLLGPGVLVRALGAALIGRMTSLPIAFAGGVAIGVIESVALANFRSGGAMELVIFAVVMAALLVRARGLARASRHVDTGLNFGAEPRAVPRRVASLPAVRLLRSGSVAAGLLVAVVLPFVPVLEFNTQAKAFLFTLVCGYAIVGLSLCLLTGWGGQVSLGQFALVGVGAFATERLQANGVPLPLILLIAGAVGALVAVAIGLPAVRIQGLFLAVTTLAFAVLCPGWAFQNRLIVLDVAGANLRRPDFLRGERALYFFALGIVVLATLAVRNFRSSGPGRVLVAVRDNDRAARSEGLSVTGARVVAFGLAGFLASVAGVIFALAVERFNATYFAPATSLTVLSMVIVGGLGSIPGAILGAVFIFGSPAIFPRSAVVDLMVSGVGLLIFLLYVPGGIIGAIHSARDALVARIARKADGRPKPPPIVPPLRDLWRAALGRRARAAA